MSKSALCFAVLLLLCGAVSMASAEFIVTFDELPFQPVDDLTVKSVTFDFKIDGADSADAFYHSFGPGTLEHVDDPSLTGNSVGILSMDFAAPTDVLEFGVALSTADPSRQALPSSCLVPRCSRWARFQSIPSRPSGRPGSQKACLSTRERLFSAR